ncbi:N-acetyltransferase [Dysgonomonas sp. 216]|uniref:GNAT family N-acetyltransferase n=1 Tax=Dysgonomonas sp. 216 TaxID=2302934 RepID=UPI0013D1D912|nr:GNAT family N-acetyltransferase [Dysgonomonas sp. 216]NDW19335.1 N-acetyltransferase [Dysgonomonas sp. 216]
MLIKSYRKEYKETLVGILEQNIPQFFDESEVKDFEYYLDNEIEQYFVIEYENNIIGSGGINFENEYKTAKISWDFISPIYQGQGFGKMLLDYRLNILKSMSTVENILVRTSQHAYLFYEKNGFVLIEIQKDYWAQGFDMYKMKYSL